VVAGAFTCIHMLRCVPWCGGQLMVTTAPVAGSICGVWVLLWGSCELPVPRVTGSWLLIPCGWLQMMWVEDIDLFVCFAWGMQEWKGLCVPCAVRRSTAGHVSV
jgi:hypothetical protein